MAGILCGLEELVEKTSSLTKWVEIKFALRAIIFNSQFLCHTSIILLPAPLSVGLNTPAKLYKREKLYIVQIRLYIINYNY